MELIIAISALCQLNIGAMGLSIDKLSAYELQCQQYYIKCIGDSLPVEAKLKTCIMERKL